MALSIWNRLESLVFGGAIAGAFSRAVEPILEPVRQKAWQRNQVRILGATTAAELAARGFAKLADVTDEAARSGIDANRLQALYDLAQEYPGLADVDKLTNRKLIGPDDAKRILARHGFGAEWVAPLMALFNDLLSVAEVANAVQQGHMPNNGVLPEFDTSAPAPPGYTTPTPPDGAPPSEVPLTQIDLDPITEAGGQGYDLKRLQVATNLAGLPPPEGALREMLNRGIIDEATFDAGIREGHTKTKWIGPLKRLRWAVIPAREYAEAWLRAWVTEDEAKAGGALTGYTASQMELLYKNRGRTATPRQLWLAVVRGVTAPDYPDQPANGRLTSFEDHELAIKRSNIQPWYAPLLWDIRWNYPPLFQLNNLVKAGAVDPDTAGTWAGYNLEAPEVVEKLKVYWASVYPGPGGPGGKAGPSSAVKSQQTAAITATRKAYVEGNLAQAQAIEQLEAVGVSPDDAAKMLPIWDVIYQVENAQPPGSGGPH